MPTPVEARPLSPELLPDYLAFFDGPVSKPFDSSTRSP